MRAKRQLERESGMLGRRRPILGLTMGDPAGVGPEIGVKALAARMGRRGARLFVAGSSRVLADAARRHAPALRFVRISRPAELEEALREAGDRAVVLLDPPGMPRRRWKPGRVDASTGLAAYHSLEAAVGAILAGHADGVVTAPLHKGALDAAGIAGPGHTEIVARLAGVRDVALMLCHDRVRVAHATLHEPLARALAHLSRRRVATTIRLVDEALRSIGIIRPRIGVFALNPHAGEGGLMGREEERLVVPAIRDARTSGIDATGPHPADTLFVRHVAGEFDALVALYHDQGHIPFKLFAFGAGRVRGRRRARAASEPAGPGRRPDAPTREGLSVRGVNVTLGLPFVRTSVDHGVALDIAGRGIADPSSLLDAIDLADEWARGRFAKDEAARGPRAGQR